MHLSIRHLTHGGCRQPALTLAMVCLLGAHAGVANAAQATKQPAKQNSNSCVVGSSMGEPAGLPTSGPASLVGYLVEIPDPAAAGCDVTSLENGTAGMALGAMGSITTISLFLAFLAGRGGFELVDGIAKATVAIALVVSYHWLYPDGITIANDASKAILSLGPGGSTTRWVTQLGLGSLSGPSIVGLLGSNPVGWLANIVILLMTLVVLVGVLIMKIVLSATTIFLYCAGPIPIALWPIQSLRWITEKAGKAAAACFLVPPAWSLFVTVFGVLDFAAGGQAAVNGVLAGTSWGSLTRQIVAIALLFALIAIPRSLLREATGGGGGGGVVRQTISFTTSSLASHAVGRAVGRTVDAIRGPQATLTVDASGNTVGYAETRSVRGRARSNAREGMLGSEAAMEAGDVWREPAERAVAFERRLAADTPEKARTSTGDALRQRLAPLSVADRNGVRSAYQRYVAAPAEDGQPTGDYASFSAAVATEAATPNLPGGYRDAYRAAAAATPRALDQAFGGRPGPGSPLAPTGGADADPPAAPPPPGPVIQPLPNASVGAPRTSGLPPASRLRLESFEPATRPRVIGAISSALEQYGDGTRGFNASRIALNRLAGDRDTPTEDRQLLAYLAGAGPEELRDLLPERDTSQDGESQE